MYTHAVHQRFPYKSLHPVESLISAIDDAQPDLLIPCDDRAVQHLHELFVRAHGEGPVGAAAAALIERSLGASESYPIVTSRSDLLEVAREEGIRVPDTKAINSTNDLEFWQSGQPLPWVLKADGSFGGMGVRIVQAREQAEKAFAELNCPFRVLRVAERLVVDRDPFWLRPWWNHRQPSVIAQAYIQGRPANCAVACWEGKILAGISAEVLCAVGMIGPAVVVRIVDNSEMLLAAEKLARRLRLSGFFGLDFMIEDRTRAPYLIEMNARCTPLCHLQLGEGRDLVGALWTKLSGEAMRTVSPIIQNDTIAYFPGAWRHNKELLDLSYQDIPWDDPELIEALLRAWPSHTLLFRLRHVISATFKGGRLRVAGTEDRKSTIDCRCSVSKSLVFSFVISSRANRRGHSSEERRAAQRYDLSLPVPRPDSA